MGPLGRYAESDRTTAGIAIPRTRDASAWSYDSEHDAGFAAIKLKLTETRVKRQPPGTQTVARSENLVLAPSGSAILYPLARPIIGIVPSARRSHHL